MEYYVTVAGAVTLFPVALMAFLAAITADVVQREQFRHRAGRGYPRY